MPGEFAFSVQLLSNSKDVRVNAGWCFTLAIVILSVFSWPVDSPAETKGRPSPLVVVTSFPESLYLTVRDEFKSAHPQFDVQVINKKTTAAISYIQQTLDPPPDLFWASSPDAFEILKESGHLQPYRFYSTQIPAAIRHYPIHDPDGCYLGFAISGYGIMYNRKYLKQHHLIPPANWGDLTSPRYFKHIGMSAPSRSGTTHLAVESILQFHGWAAGWKMLLELGGNLATITARSYGVPDGVNSGRFGIGIAIDFFGLSSKALGMPVEFTYSHETALLPASIAVIKGAPNGIAARRFIDFLLSEQGQQILFKPHISRLPVIPAVYQTGPVDYPNPFEDDTPSGFVFDSELSKQRYNLVNTLFDHLITHRRNALRRAWQTIHQAERRRASTKNAAVGNLIDQARLLATWVPVTAEEAQDKAFASVFIRNRRGQPLPAKQATLEDRWERSLQQKIRKAQDLAHQALMLSK